MSGSDKCYEKKTQGKIRVDRGDRLHKEVSISFSGELLFE